MSCQEYRDRVTVHLADGSEAPGDHGASCPGCARYAEQARAAWEAAGRAPVEPVPAALTDSLLRECRRPRRVDLTLLRPGPLAAAVILAALGAILFWPSPPGPGAGSLMAGDGMSVERYELPAGASAEAVAEEIRRTVMPEAWGEGIGGLEAGPGFLRVRGPAELQRAVKNHLQFKEILK